MLCAARAALRGVCLPSTSAACRRGLCVAANALQVEYEERSKESLEKLFTYFDTFPESFEVAQEYDVNYAMGVINVLVSKDVGTYVINKQSPNRQLWLSSPVSGPKRYDLENGKWLYSRENETLDALLTREFRTIFGSKDIDFSTHI